MGRLTALVLAAAAFAAPAPQTVVLRITVRVTAADGSTRPVPRHALLVSDDPVTTSPHRYVTTNEGTVEAHLRPGKYTVESDNPFIFEGKTYEWTQSVTVAAGGDTALALDAANATIVSAKAGTADSPGIAEAAAERVEAALLTAWQDSVVTIWTPHAIGRGFLIDDRGLIVTNQRLIGKDADVEVQLSAKKKVAGRVVAVDVGRNVAIVAIDPQAAAPARAMTPGYAQSDRGAVREHDKVYSIEVGAGEEKGLVSGNVQRVNARVVTSDVVLGRDNAGTPLFTASGAVVAITTAGDDASPVNEISSRSVRIDDAQAAIAEAGKKLEVTAPPPRTPLPVEPERPFPEDALKSAAKSHGTAPAASVIAASDFDISIITPPVLYASMHKAEDRDHFDYARGDRGAAQPALRPLDDFGSWNEYVTEPRPVVFVRVSPKFGERFWTTVARGAAQTQGVMIPAIRKPKAAFGGLRLTCGATDVAPIHPFRIEHRVDDGTSVDEGLYVFPASAIAPACGTVKVTVFPDKPQDKGDTRTIDPKIVQRVAEDFASLGARR